MEEAAQARQGRLAKWRRRLRASWESLLAEHATPARLGVAVGVGVFCGCSPFHGFQFLLALLLAWALRVNKLAVMVGLQISAPPVTPLIGLAGLQSGALLLHGRLLPLRPGELRAAVHGSLTRALLTDFVVGSLALGVGLGMLLGLLTTAWVRRRRARTGEAAHRG